MSLLRNVCTTTQVFWSPRLLFPVRPRNHDFIYLKSGGNYSNEKKKTAWFGVRIVCSISEEVLLYEWWGSSPLGNCFKYR